MSRKEIKNIDDLRQHAIETIHKLTSKKIDIDEAGVTGKLYENIISSVKVELEHNKMIGYDNPIRFIMGEKEVKGRVIKQAQKSLK